jgi:chemotaxis protein CheY-P-specific phosphatase CheC
MEPRDHFLMSVMIRGFEKAAHSFSKIARVSIRMGEDSALMKEHPQLSYNNRTGDLFILITQLIGEVSGKSFLILSEKESQEIFKALGSQARTSRFEEAFLLEIDNIISASVISELANAFNAEIYGDVPRIVKVPAHKLKAFMDSEIESDGYSKIVYCNTSFHVGNVETKPQFIWKLSDEIFDIISPSIE